jgi:hypothetical protein
MALHQTSIDQTFDIWRQNTNASDVAVGDVALLTTTDKTSIVAGVNEIKAGAVVVTPGPNGNILQSNGTIWQSVTPGASGATLTDDTTTAVTQYLGMSRILTGAWTAAYVASTKLYFNPSTGELFSTSFNSSSDRNLKDNILPVTNALDTVSKMQGVSFNWKDSGKSSYGFIAQDLETVLPTVVSTNEEGTKSVNYDATIAILLEAIKELNAKVVALENK